MTIIKYEWHDLKVTSSDEDGDQTPMRPQEELEIRRLRLFRDLRDEVFQSLMQAAFLQRFPRGVELIRESEPADMLHIVVEGLVQMFSTHHGRETTIGFVRPLGTFILAAVLRDQVNLQSARTLERSRVLMIPAERVRLAMAKDAGFMTAIVAELAMGYRNTVKELKNHKLRTGPERLANWILRAQSFQNKLERVEIEMEKRVLAARLGMTPENLSRAFNVLKGAGIKVEGSIIHVESTKRLSAFAKPNPLIDDYST